ncbi:MAG: DinB family protein [Gemmatimonadales bacterium]
MSKRAAALADRIEQGAVQLASYVEKLSDKDWRTTIGPRDGRTIGVIVHHVASVYPIEVDLAKTLASGKPIAGVTWDAVHEINAKHAKEKVNVTKAEALDFLKKNSQTAATAVRALSDAELDRAATVSLNFDAPLTCQYFIEEHALRHSFHHLARMRAALGR